MLKTSNYNLNKPEYTDEADISLLNENMDAIDTALNNKVDKVAGKGLSTNDYTTTEKNKLGGIDENANNYSHPTGAGNNHIPSGGSVGQILKNTAPGEVGWAEESGGSGGDTGTFTINKETLTDNKALNKTDATYQYLDPGSANRDVTLPLDADTGKMFVIRNNGAYNSFYPLAIKQSSISLDMIYAGAIKTFIFDGTNWVSGENGTGENDDKKQNVAIGNTANGSYSGAAVGCYSNGSLNGAAIGNTANGYSSGAAVGSGAKGNFNGAAIGRNAQAGSKNYAFAKGYCSKAERYNEEVKSADGATATKYAYSTLAWLKETTDATQTEIFLGGTTNQRVLVLASSAFGFSLYITALNNADGKAKRWKVEGLIKRDGANNTALVGSVTKTVIVESDTSGGTKNWDVIVTADDTNEALKVEVKGEASKTIRWIARGEIEEVRF